MNAIKCTVYNIQCTAYTTVTTVKTVTTVTTVTTFTYVTKVSSVITVTTITVKCQILLLNSWKGNFFHKVSQPTNRPTDQLTNQLIDQPTDQRTHKQTVRQTTRLLELLSAAKIHIQFWLIHYAVPNFQGFTSSLKKKKKRDKLDFFGKPFEYKGYTVYMWKQYYIAMPGRSNQKVSIMWAVMKERKSTMHPLECTALHYRVFYCTALHCTVLYCTALHCIVLYCTALHCIVLHCTVLYCTSLHSSAYDWGHFSLNKQWKVHWRGKGKHGVFKVVRSNRYKSWSLRVFHPFNCHNIYLF